MTFKTLRRGEPSHALLPGNPHVTELCSGIRHNRDCGVAATRPTCRECARLVRKRGRRVK